MYKTAILLNSKEKAISFVNDIKDINAEFNLIISRRTLVTLVVS